MYVTNNETNIYSKNKTEWLRLSKNIYNIPYPNKIEMWELSKPSPNSKQILFAEDKNHYKAMIKLMFLNKKQTKECGFNNTKSL